eukprot:scaffold234595_cov30-Tisochrysis_lutea.AAC.3
MVIAAVEAAGVDGTAAVAAVAAAVHPDQVAHQVAVEVEALSLPVRVAWACPCHRRSASGRASCPKACHRPAGACPL